MDRLKVVAALAGISLIVTVVLYVLFDNTAVFESADKSTKLGGAVAFFFVLFLAETTVYKNLRSDPLAPVRKALCGKWKCEAELRSTGDAPASAFCGIANIEESVDGKITIIGGIEGRAETWEADEVVLTDSKLVYFFSIPVLRIGGVTNLRFTYRRRAPLSEMSGYWILAGQDGRGNIRLSRVAV